MLKIGLTGGIGSGKSTVASIFEVLGIPVYYADEAAKKMMNENPSIIQAIKNLLGEESYQNGLLNRSYIATIIFQYPEKRIELNQIVHPATIADADIWMSKQTSPYCLKEAALIFESHAEKKLNFVIGVESPLELRIKRIIKRDKISDKDVLQRIEGQMNEEEKMSRCQFVINNNESTLLIPQVLEIHHQILKMSESNS